MYVYHIITIINDDLEFSEETQILYLLPVIALVIPSIYLIRARMFNKLTDADKTLEELEEEFKITKRSFRDYF